jgi:uncharacterized protein (TIGR00725 family)
VKANRKLKIGVLGPHDCTNKDLELGVAVGAEIARRGAILVCGGLGGMMEAAAKGARSEGGLTVGILPGDKPDDANPFIEIALPTGLGAVRNALLVRSCDAVIAICGGYGTLSEIAFALRLRVPVVGLNTWSVSRNGEVDAGIRVATTPKEAVATAVKLAKGCA